MAHPLGCATVRRNDYPASAWNESSTYIQEPPFFTTLTLAPATLQGITGARVLASEATHLFEPFNIR